MSNQLKTTSWLWSAGAGVNGVRIDLDKRHLEWYDDLGCACDDSTADQSFADYLASGPAFGNPPEDVRQELQSALAVLLDDPTKS